MVRDHCFKKFRLVAHQIFIIQVCTEGTQLCNMKKRHWRRSMIQETLYTGQWYLSPLRSRHLGTSHSSPNRHQLPCRIFLNIINSLKSLPFQKWFCFGEKPEVTGYQIWAVAGMSHLGDLLFHQKTLHETRCMSGHVVMVQLPITSCHSCGLLNHLNSLHRGMFKLNAKFDADSLLYLFSHFECDSHTVHMLSQWCLPPPLTSTVESSLFTHVHSSPLSLAARLHRCRSKCSHYTNNGWTFSRQTSSYIFLKITRKIKLKYTKYKPHF